MVNWKAYHQITWILDAAVSAQEPLCDCQDGHVTRQQSGDSQLILTLANSSRLLPFELRNELSRFLLHLYLCRVAFE